jgi:hypothetical protein
VQGATVPSASDLRVGALCRIDGRVRGNGIESSQLQVVARDTVQTCLGQFNNRELAAPDELRLFVDCGERDLVDHVFVARKGGVGHGSVLKNSGRSNARMLSMSAFT